MQPTASAATCPKRLRVFAGPNGSGKSTIIAAIRRTHIPCGLYINADDLMRGLKVGWLSLGEYLPSVALEDIRRHHDSHPQANGAAFPFVSGNDDRSIGLSIPPDSHGLSYSVAVLADYLRHQVLARGMDLSFETVFSHPSKLDFMRLAKSSGYRVYLYFVGVASAAICSERVALRVSQGGHDVDERKIEDRYKRCLELLEPAIALTDRSFIFDNSDTPKHGQTSIQTQLKLEVTNAADVKFHCDSIPAWIAKAIPAIFGAPRNT